MVKKEKEPVWKSYIDFQNRYTEIYGENTICFIQVGSFYEIYSLANSGYIKKACDIMGIIVSQKNIGIEVNPFMAGIPDHGVLKFLKRLIENDYTIVLIDQIGVKNSRGEYEKREVSKILTRANIDLFFEITNDYDRNHANDTNNIISIYVEEEKTLKGKIVISVGISVIDLSTGINHVYEFNSQTQEIFEEMYRFIETYNPIEIIIQTVNLKMYTQEELLNKINTIGRKVYYNFYDNLKTAVFYKLSYKEELLKKVFKNNTLLSIFDYLNLATKHYAINSYIILLQFSYEHEIHIINKIRKPEIFENNKYLNLYNNALYQLDIIPAKNINIRTTNSRYRSLFDVINNTSTAMGRRELKDRLLNPITDITELNFRYRLVETMLSRVDNYEEHLKKILDIERYHRKLTLKIIQPSEFAILYESYECISKILNIYHNDFCYTSTNNNNNNDLISEEDIKKYGEFYEEYKKLFNIDIMINYSTNNIDQSFFNRGIFQEIDQKQEQIDQSRIFFENIINNFSKWIRELEGKADDKKVIEMSYHEKKGNKNGAKREGEYILKITKRRADLLKQILNTKKINGYTYETHNNTEVKLISAEISKMSEKYINCINDIDELVLKKYREIIDAFDEKYDIQNIARFIAIIDVIKSTAKTSNIFGYVKPNILAHPNNETNSFISAIDLRHPIVERLAINTSYVVNDVHLSDPDPDQDPIIHILVCFYILLMRRVKARI